jgi:hypothetical protein
MTQHIQREFGAPFTKAGSPYLAYSSPFEAKAEGLTAGKDYQSRIIIDPDHFPAATICWHYPLRQTKTTKPWGYDAISHGSPSGGAPRVAVPKRKLVDITALTVAWDCDVQIISGDANVLSDTFLYSDDTLKKRVLEIGIFARASDSARSFAKNHGKPVGTNGRFIDRTKREWFVQLAGAYCMLLPADTALNAEIDGPELFDFLQGAGLVTGSEVYPGTAIGVEPISGAGVLRLNSFDVVTS